MLENVTVNTDSRINIVNEPVLRVELTMIRVLIRDRYKNKYINTNMKGQELKK